MTLKPSSLEKGVISKSKRDAAVKRKIISPWFGFFSNYGQERFTKVIEYYLAHCQWFPKAPLQIQELWDNSGEDQRGRQEFNQPALSAESSEFTPEQQIENLKKINLAWRISNVFKGRNMPNLGQYSVAELEAMITAQEAASREQLPIKVNEEERVIDPFLSDLKVYLLSGIDRHYQQAIDWVKDDSDFELVYEGNRAVNIKRKSKT